MIPNVIGGLVELFSKKKEANKQPPFICGPYSWSWEFIIETYPFGLNSIETIKTEDIPHEVVETETKILTDGKT